MTLPIISIPQPLATLAGLGVVTVLVRPESGEELVGSRVGLYADETPPTGCYPSDDHLNMAGRDAVPTGEYGIAIAARHWPLPLGAVVASATLQACVPYVAYGTRIREPWMPHVGPAHRGELWHWHGPSEYENPSTGRPTWEITDLSDQLPYLSDIRPGMWAWLLADAKPAEVNETRDE